MTNLISTAAMTVAAISSVINLILLYTLIKLTKNYASSTERYASTTEDILSETRKSNETLKLASYAHAYTWAANMLSDKDLIKYREKIMLELDSYNGSVDEMPAGLREAFEQVGRTYDLVGIAGHNGMLPYEIIAKEWGDSIIKTHEKCERFLLEFRLPEKRGPMFWDNYTELYRTAKRIWKYSKHSPTENE